MLTKGKEIYSKVTQPVIDQFYRNISVLNALKKERDQDWKVKVQAKRQIQVVHI